MILGNSLVSIPKLKISSYCLETCYFPWVNMRNGPAPTSKASLKFRVKTKVPLNGQATAEHGQRSEPQHLLQTKVEGNRFDVNSQEFKSSVSRATLLASKNGLINYDELPPPWRINLYIRTGYRFTHSIFSTALSPLCLSNELVNIWTHLIPVFLILRYPLHLNPPFETFRDGGLGRQTDAFVAITYCATAALSLVCSTAWHTFRCSSRLRVMAAFVCVDIMSVSLILTAFNILVIHTLFYARSRLREVYIFSSLLWCLAGVVLPWTNLFRPVEIAPLVVRAAKNWPLSRGWNRVIFFCGLGGQGQIIPALHSAYVNGWAYTSAIYVHAIPVVLPIFLGSLLYGSKFPERVWPGRFDYIGCSHNMWHVATAISALAGCWGMLGMFEVAWGRSA